MILIDGKILKSEETHKALTYMKAAIIRTLQKPVLNPYIVVEACDKLAQAITEGKYNKLIEELKSQHNISPNQISSVIQMFTKDSLLYKLEVELGAGYCEEMKWSPLNSYKIRKKKHFPLGVLFHIAAGNVDGLPAYSVIEGLLVGNINILKLPQADNGLSIKLLSELIRIEPKLSEYIYVFDTPSYDLKALRKMAALADGIVVWGGDKAITAVRQLAAPGKKIIEWGHKISFAYITENGMTDNYALEGLAEHIFETNQLLCSSCQGIFIDTADMKLIYKFCEKFLSIMEKVAGKYPKPDFGIRGQLTLQLYNKELEIISSEQRIFRGKGCSIVAYKNNKLETSIMYGNCWAMPLPKKHIIKKLYSYRGYLQTVGLICDMAEKEEISEMLTRAGVTRITSASEMSTILIGQAHDGEYPLRRYSRIVEY